MYHFDDLVHKYRLKERISLDSGIAVVSLDTNIVMRDIATSFLRSGIWYEVRIVSGVAAELQRALLKRDVRDELNYDRIAENLLNATAVDVEVDRDDEYLITAAVMEAYKRIPHKMRSKHRGLRTGDIGNVDMQQISLGLERGRKDLSTILLTNDVGIIKTVEVLKENPDLNKYLDGKVIAQPTWLHLEKYAA